MSRRRNDDDAPGPRKSRSSSPSSVEKLIEQRRLIEEWLDKLAAGGSDGMPPHVIERVRNDYTSRLASLTQELSEHSDDLRQRLAEAETRREELAREQSARRDELAELKLRRQVGEVDDGRFKEQQHRLKDTIDDLSKELAATLREIDRLEDVLETMNEEEEEEEQEQEQELEQEKVKPADAGKEKKGAGAKAEEPAAPAAPPAAKTPEKAPDQDELSFLRSLTSVRPAVKLPPAAPAAPATPVAPVTPATPVPPPPAPKPTAAAAAPAEEQDYELEQAVDPTKPRLRPSRIEKAHVEGERTLTCGECGAKNLPTEWYCEKCGAELANF